LEDSFSNVDKYGLQMLEVDGSSKKFSPKMDTYNMLIYQ